MFDVKLSILSTFYGAGSNIPAMIGIEVVFFVIFLLIILKKPYLCFKQGLSKFIGKQVEINSLTLTHSETLDVGYIPDFAVHSSALLNLSPVPFLF